MRNVSNHARLPDAEWNLHPEQIDCGGDIVEHIAVCGECHSGRLPNGAIDPATFLAGSADLVDLDPGDDTKGLVPAPNLTQLADRGWTSADIVEAIQNGVGKGRPLFPIMPYQTFHNMAFEDAQAIAAYILDLTPITNDIPPRQPLPFPAELPAKTVDVALIPDPVGTTAANADQAALGKYLATRVGVCMECHTARTETGDFVMAKAFAGGEPFQMPSPPFPPVVYSLNITPDPSGIAGWTPTNVRDMIKTGVARDGSMRCPPMPFGPMGGFGEMSDDHAFAIGQYLTHLPPIANSLEDGGTIPKCTMPEPPPGPPDGGAPDAAPDASTAPDASDAAAD